MKKLLILTILTLFVVVIGCTQRKDDGSGNPPIELTSTIPVTETSDVQPKNENTPNTSDVMQSGCGKPQGNAYYQPKTIINSEIPKCYVGVIEVIGTYSRADIDEILAFVQQFSEDEEISSIRISYEISSQFDRGEIAELPTNIAMVFYGIGGGSLYTIEKIDGTWQVIEKGYWIE
jgi:hypothetical protein